ncbi:MAG TPA: crosslink repair DNA glycosylase YcaQ family protein, partial [Actinomycetota bacterium]|nr:crosslink repair DNA glycosylase YcaQ family protein [Actinomycetota bacterium]
MAGSAPTVSWAAANRRRLARHALREPAPAGNQPAEIARAVCGAHAQVLAAAEVSLALRVDGATRADVRHALWEDRSLVKTYGPRGTVHLLPTRDLPMWTGALSAIPGQSPFPEGVRLTPDQTEAVVGAIGTALADAELTVDELTDAVVDLAGPWAGERVMPAFQDLWPRWRQAVDTAAHRGVLCFG